MTTAVVTKTTEKSSLVAFFAKIFISKFLSIEVSIRSPETNGVLTPIASVETEDSVGPVHRPLAPLASSETFTDLTVIGRDEPIKEEIKAKSSTKSTKNEFDSLEALFDFPSSGISSNTHLNVDESTRHNCNMNFSERDQIIRSAKVKSRFVFFSLNYYFSSNRMNKKLFKWKKSMVHRMFNVLELIQLLYQHNRMKQHHRTFFYYVSSH